ncbi:MAG: alpha/beta fold hydrolase, partial [Pseudomonadota bacterium]
MALLAIDVTDDGPRPHDGGHLGPTVDAALADVPPDAPVVILIHGYRYSPMTQADNPHRHILSLVPRKDCWKALSWPRHLGFGRGHQAEGLCVAFGWEARGSIWRAWRNAHRAGAALADLVKAIRARHPGAVHIVAHSLGARVALAAMPLLPRCSLGRVILMAAAEFQSTAASAFATPAGQTAEVFNIQSAENAFFDRCLEWCVPAPSKGDRALGAGLDVWAPNWLDIRVDDCATRDALRRLGHRIPAPRRKVCHWCPHIQTCSKRTVTFRWRRNTPFQAS